MVDGFKRSYAVGTLIRHGSADDMVINPNLDVLSAITSGGWNFRGENRILLYLNVFKHFLYAGGALPVARDVTAMIYPPNVSAFVDGKNRQIVTNFASVLFNTQVKALKHDGNICTFINFILASLLHHNEALKGLSGEANMITVAFLQAAYVLSISSDTLKEWGEKVKEQHERMNKVSMRFYNIMI